MSSTKLNSSWSAAVILASLIFLLAPASSRALSDALSISTPEQIKAEFESVPCKNDDRLGAARALFEKAGAPADDISVEKYKNVENLVVRKKGATEEKIVVGAHYDKVADGCGAVDNWTGVVTLAQLYKSLKGVSLKKTFVFVAFGKEEEGLVGSHAMVNAIGKEQAAQYCEMINIDSLGMGAPQVADNMSNRKLGDFAGVLAKEMKMPFGHTTIEGANADSSSFLDRKIPALTIYALGNDWRSVLHSRNDQPSRVNAESVYLGYRLALALAVRLDAAACDEYR